MHQHIDDGKAPVLTRLAARDILADSAAAARSLVAAHLRLYTAGPLPNPEMVIGEFTEATFAGYGSVGPIVWKTPVFDTDAKIARMLADSPSGLFVATGAGPTENILGYYLTDSLGTVVLAARQFVAPVLIQHAGDFLDVTPTIILQADVQG